MANLDAPRGFTLVQNQSTGAFNTKLEAVAFVATDATPAFQGSMVVYTGDQVEVEQYGLVPVVTLAAGAASTAQLAGAIQTFEYEASDWDTRYRAANTLKVGFLPADKNAEYEVQEDSDGGSIDPATNTGNNVDFTVESGNTLTGVSTMELDSSTAANTATLPLRLVKYISRADNETGASSTNAKWIVRVNLDAYSNALGVN